MGGSLRLCGFGTGIPGVFAKVIAARLFLRRIEAFVGASVSDDPRETPAKLVHQNENTNCCCTR